MDSKTIDWMLKQQPFYPLRLHMTGRYSVEIHRPEWVKLSASTLTLHEPDPADPSKLCWKSTLALMHVVSMEQIRPDEPVVVSASTSG